MHIHKSGLTLNPSTGMVSFDDADYEVYITDATKNNEIGGRALNKEQADYLTCAEIEWKLKQHIPEHFT